MFEPTAPENGGDDARNALIRRVQTKRTDVDTYLGASTRRRRRLVQVTIVAGSIAAALTAAPALGGPPLADWLTEAFALGTPSWRILCAIAALCSVAATVATQLHKSNNYDERIARAQGVRATLEVLEVGIVSGQLTRQQAASRFIKCVESASFIEPADSH
jgi:MFS family permease